LINPANRFSLSRSACSNLFAICDVLHNGSCAYNVVNIVAQWRCAHAHPTTGSIVGSEDHFQTISNFSAQRTLAGPSSPAEFHCPVRRRRAVGLCVRDDRRNLRRHKLIHNRVTHNPTLWVSITPRPKYFSKSAGERTVWMPGRWLRHTSDRVEPVMREWKI
jgi:hypothetical protein